MENNSCLTNHRGCWALPFQPGTGRPVTPGVGWSGIPSPTHDAVMAQPVSERYRNDIMLFTSQLQKRWNYTFRVLFFYNIFLYDSPKLGLIAPSIYISNNSYFKMLSVPNFCSKIKDSFKIDYKNWIKG